MYGPIEVESDYETDGVRLLSLVNGTTLTGWNTANEYVVVPANYGDAATAQRVLHAYQGNAVTGKITTSVAPHRWG